MKIKVKEIMTWAKGNGVPCNGGLYEGNYNGEIYRAEWYGDVMQGSEIPRLMLAADSRIEIKKR